MNRHRKGPQPADVLERIFASVPIDRLAARVTQQSQEELVSKSPLTVVQRERFWKWEQRNAEVWERLTPRQRRQRKWVAWAEKNGVASAKPNVT